MSDPHADEQTLRDALAFIASSIEGDTGSRDTSPVPETELGERHSRPRRWWMAGVAAAAVAACVTAVLISRDSPPTESDHEKDATTSAQSEAEWVACAEYIVEGTVTATVGAGPPDRITLTIKVADWVKPDRGAQRLEVRVRDPKAVGLDPIIQGEKYLFVIPANSQLAPDVFGQDFIADYRRIIDRVSAQAADTKCPQYWQTSDGS